MKESKIIRKLNVKIKTANTLLLCSNFTFSSLLHTKIIRIFFFLKGFLLDEFMYFLLIDFMDYLLIYWSLDPNFSAYSGSEEVCNEI